MSSSMSWAEPADVYLSTSLASYLDTNVVLEGACERLIVGDLYCDIPLGLYVIRGENVVLIGELDPLKRELPPNMVRVSEPEIRSAQKVEREASELMGTMKKRMDFLDMD
ncbi:sm-like protein LSM1B isoform X2 [Salvia miltiorrhiza]|uniref:sm-like protein LSM1B isoform X2 n=1 Tax=Salvia miltiorrhiza TaxID=226208 RepID=UPI0025ABC2C9|nr:sm-like protein LSM1B isoform X2 [Salvia miltiorrhiza]